MTDTAPPVFDHLSKEALDALRKPFEAAQVGKLPRITCPDCRGERSKECRKNQEHMKSRCNVCNQWITGAHINLDFVGHADVTDRLLSVDPNWTWEPMGTDADGLPVIRSRGETATMWIRLTVLGSTKLGVGSVGTKKDDVEKELIGDALRNAAMRFGVALTLWSKGDLESEKAEDAEEGTLPEPPPPPPSQGVQGVQPAQGGQAGTNAADTTPPAPPAQDGVPTPGPAGGAPQPAVEGEPLLDEAQANQIIAIFEELTDPDIDLRARRAFVESCGKPSQIAVSQLEVAKAYARRLVDSLKGQQPPAA